MLTFADALFAYMGDLAELSHEGYVQALAELGEEPDNRRRRLLRRILGGTAVARSALAELAEHCAWRLPDEVTMVALAPGTRPRRQALDADILQDLADPEPYLLVPGPLTEDRRACVEEALGGCRAAVGLTTGLGEAADSLRWARHTLALAGAGAVSGGSLLLGEDHLLPLWLLSDQALADQMAARYLAPLAALTPAQQARLLDTLRIWLTTRGTAAQIAEQLGVHPQTVRYRMRILERAFGQQLAHPDERFATEIAVRALHLRDGGGSARAPRGPAGSRVPRQR
ncbi:helix-turn-helix domain-containing protein [Streptomyces sp. NBC_00433]